LSVRECARLQTFPDHFEFVSGHGASDAGVKQSLRGLGNARATRVGEEYRMVGNAVPPLLATRVGDAFLRANFSPVSDDESA
jgi:site-specific DNA-cytosine methylase